MAITRRIFVSGAVAAPLVAQLGGSGSAVATAQPGDQNLTVLNGLAELQLTDLALKQLATQGIRMQAVAPATAIMGSDGRTVQGVKLTPEYTTGTVKPTGQPGTGRGRVFGGVVLVNDKARMEISGLRGGLPDSRVFAFLKVGDEWLGELPLYTADPSKVRLSLKTGAPGQPTAVQGSGISVTPTQEGLDAFSKAFGTALFTTKDTVFTASAQGNAWPLPSQPAG
ncbi:hypothetical protein P3102_15700 [Amycolatopsis sp. QT-25]|uniref:hypothetical protein n=1 Tax=Amycolatopsis sp. QT-25 TaxID=3034022 RepID=UPI0023ED286D|nr:hypothetical protein [Amycolatopsis sp. QT-25]WET83482.1 hypothetical protein P3102_15700 [Amycolatopsis sp. QT-25]